jgi:adenylate cyclase
VETLTAGALPWRPSWVSRSEIFGAGALCLVAILLAIFRRPVTATVLMGLVCLIWEFIALGEFAWGQLLVDPAGPPFIAVVAFAATALGNYAQNERLERALRLRFEQYLAPDIVKRLVDAPGMLRLDGERREVTAMFTDIEGFTSLTERSEAGEVVRLLDNYLTIVTNIVIAHGGMVDALIGDGVFALFNAPLDLADHARRGLAAAQAIIAATENYRDTGLAAKLALGRTRIGIESGMAIVGDVGGGGKLDYTARGNVVNTASRLEALNKELKTTICIGPLAAAKLGASEIQRVGVMKIRGRSAELEVFTVANWRPYNDQSAAASSLERPTAK